MRAWRALPSPLGPLTAEATERGVSRLAFEGLPGPAGEAPRGPARRHLDALETQLAEYFAGRRTRFELPLDLEGSDWERRVWAALRRIPHGRTRSYLDVAIALDRPGASRAVGQANGRNPVSIVVPCHRVVASGGGLGGYGGGLDRKRWLLAHEGARASLF